MVSKINCSKNDQRRIDEISAKSGLGDHPAAPPGEDSELRVAARKAIIMSGFQAVERGLKCLEQPQTLQLDVLHGFQKKARAAGGHQEVADIGNQESERDQKPIVLELSETAPPPK